jgi:oligopeptide transport system permease protein
MPYIVKYSLKRIGLLLVTTFIILTITFFLVKMLPNAAMPTNEAQLLAYCQDQVGLGNYVLSFAEDPSLGTLANSITTDDSITYYFYYAPLVKQYGNWLVGIFTRWDWGVSTAVDAGKSAMLIIGERLKPTILINVFTIIIAIPLGFIFGIVAALHKNQPIDNFISTVVMIFISVPSFVTISLLMLWLCYDNQWLPSSWPVNGTPAQYASAMVVPVLALTFGTVAAFTRYTRAELCEVMSSEFLLLARTKGLSRSQCIVRHALRNSMVPIVPMIIGQFIGILGGSIILEQLYGINGIGQLFIQCINYKDYNVLLVDMAVFTVIDLVANLLVDLSYGIVDPRIRMGAKNA